MKRAKKAQALRSLVLASLACLAFEACSNSSDDSSAAGGTPTITINPVTTTLACDDSLVVSLTTNLTLRPPYNCGTTPLCGSVAVSLLETQDGTPLIPVVRAATADVQLDLSSLVNPATADAPSLSQAHFIKVEAFNDSLASYDNVQAIFPADGTALTLLPPTASCGGAAGAGNGGEGGMSGASSAGANSGGESGEGGASGGAGAAQGGSGGTAQAGSGGSAQGGSAGSAQGGTAGSVQGGSGGTAGTGG